MSEIEVLSSDPMTVAVVSRRFRRDEISKTVETAMPVLRAYEKRSGTSLAALPFCKYSEWTAGGVTVDVGLEVQADASDDGEVSVTRILESRHAVVEHRGHFNELPITHAKLEQWIVENGYEANGIAYDFFMTSPEDEPDPSEWRVKVVWEVK